MNTNCNWMNLQLSSPYVLASITPFSNMRVHEHALFLRKAIDYGGGAIILPSVNPDADDAEHEMHIIDTRVNQIKTGAINGENSSFAFSLLGGTKNIATLGYVTSLHNTLRKMIAASNIRVPIIASIANIGSSEQFISTLRKIAELEGILGIELNFSCPNVITSTNNSLSEVSELLGLQLFTADLLKQVRQICKGLPISIKLPPNMDYSSFIEYIRSYIDGLTLSNAYIGLEPPIIGTKPSTYCPAFPSYTSWSPTGIYGPFERLLTYRDLYMAILSLDKKHYDKLSVSCVGGIVTAEQGLAAIMLGADTVQLSSTIAWNGLRSFEAFNLYLERFMSDNKIENIKDLKGIALSSICESADKAIITKKEKRTAIIDTNMCLRCETCFCCERLCLAILQNYKGEPPQINSTLCNGCGWCKDACIGGAITFNVFDRST